MSENSSPGRTPEDIERAFMGLCVQMDIAPITLRAVFRDAGNNGAQNLGLSPKNQHMLSWVGRAR